MGPAKRWKLRETVEFRIPEDRVGCLFSPSDGIRLGSDRLGSIRLGTGVRKIVLPRSNPRVKAAGILQKEMNRRDRSFFTQAILHRSYSKSEIVNACILHLDFTAVFEPAGEECGTTYDETTACHVCGAGRTQTSELVLDLRKVPRKKDIARTIADEWIVSQRLAEVLLRERATGFELHPVRHRGFYKDDSIDPRAYPAGRELIRRAASWGISYDSWAYWVWVNLPPQRELLLRLDEEHEATMRRRDARRPRRAPLWYQLIVTSSPLPTLPPTQFGVDIFDEDAEGRYRCPLGHVAGLNLLSELWVDRGTWSRSDVSCTKELVGDRRGLLVPAPLLLISQRLRRLLESNGIKGYNVEVAHLA